MPSKLYKFIINSRKMSIALHKFMLNTELTPKCNPYLEFWALKIPRCTPSQSSC